MKKTLMLVLFFSFCILPAFSGQAIGQYWEYDVPYVPTPYEVVTEMLKVVDITKDDIVYDLGCGDGRIVIMAAEKTGCHGIGVDINPVRIKESNENAVKAKVTDRVKFLEQNLFDVDVSQASVVTLYLLTNVNLKLRPKLLHDLKPGTRLVSHNYSMGEWKPDKSMEVMTGMESHSVYFWIVPANVSGTWRWSAASDNSGKQYVVRLEQNFQDVKGVIITNNGEIPIENAVLSGNKLQFTVTEKEQNNPVVTRFEGLIHDNTVEGTLVTAVPGNQKRTAPWKAQRDPSTVIPIDTSNSK